MRTEADLHLILEKIVDNYYPDSPVGQKLLEGVKHIVSSFSDLGGRASTLYSICVPKQLFPKIGFLAAPGGTPYKYRYSSEQLDLIQSGVRPGHERIPVENHPTLEGRHVMPQVRLLAHKLRPEDGITIVPHYSENQKNIEKIESELDLLLEEIPK